ncbi:zinc finger CCCH domain-containing protein ASCRUDRAFT_71428 [Ascoidea rubescens DSM 1968]|uniref:C3H1-type domain-containing protein n=1 Tax=Ascoidea rubescens DSM 1968 TaxID=1344418 RepID=A0A1D2VE64_9ASCO|nr:hypothetical protein ASCRUDRAFT_71418 [Ascoidea rubescens DSM 1968]XP_020046262.1 hypothetical protein ASCRUDRAFT_71428 [Ascoidea rubescens DSM 1968]ODV59941.1 hypothetical protein ASCRUDRAFT_71418 [Ascoidea rubescens DSM 1968]ODV59955.1 hypothetical protein ASCRUDRAFT_71428 [Ascoidea rubescens DSM 1968]
MNEYSNNPRTNLDNYQFLNYSLLNEIDNLSKYTPVCDSKFTYNHNFTYHPNPDPDPNSNPNYNTNHNCNHSHNHTDNVNHNMIYYKKKNFLYKTAICISYFTGQQCRFGSFCNYAHSLDKIRPINVPCGYKTKLCCNEYTYLCNFKHCFYLHYDE